MDVTKKMYCSKSQKEMLIELLQKDPQLISGKFTKHFTYKEARKRWTTIADTLNALPGCSKDWSQWKRTWQDSRTKVRSKKVMVNRHLNGTGGGLQLSETLTSTDRKILELVSPVTIDGDMNIPTPDINFQFDDIIDLPIEFENVNSNDENNIFTSQPGTSEKTNSNFNEVIATIETKKDKMNVAPTKRLTNSLAVGKDICDIGKQKLKLKEMYYEKKILLLERQTVALESIANKLLA